MEYDSTCADWTSKASGPEGNFPGNEEALLVGFASVASAAGRPSCLRAKGSWYRRLI